MKRHTLCQWSAIVCFGLTGTASPTIASDGPNPYATKVISYDPGSPEPMLVDPDVVIGSPARMTGADIFPAVVSPFNPPWTANEIVSIGPGGHLTVVFDEPITNDPNHLYGIDLLIFGNIGFFDSNWPNAIVGGLLSNPSGVVEVSADGDVWHTIPDVDANGLFPTLGYLDAGPYDEEPGRVPSDFTRPVDPALTMDHLIGLQHQDVVDLYYGSGGGAGVDLSTVGLSEINYVRIANPPGASGNVQVDGFARVSPTIPGDVNLDGQVNVDDLLIILNNWGPAAPGGPPIDQTGDGQVNVDDLLIVLNNWGA